MYKPLLKILLPVIAVVLLAPWPIAYAYDGGGTAGGQSLIQVTATASDAQPKWTAFGGASGTVTGGDLFYIKATDSQVDFSATLYLTNAPELVHTYQYLILHLSFYRQGQGGDWQKVTELHGQPLPDMYLTMTNSQVRFTLPGSASYKVTIDGGSFHANPMGSSARGISPSFYLEIN